MNARGEGGGGRSAEFRRNDDLETLLTRINGLLGPANVLAASEIGAEKFPKIFVMGPLRSGTTLFTQWLAATGCVGYPTNFLSRFYGAPLIGALIQRMLADPKFDFRGELSEFSEGFGFSSENGKTKGAMAPNEFWYFWRRFLPFGEVDFAPDEVLDGVLRNSSFRSELDGLCEVFEKPFLAKAMILNQNATALAGLFDKVVLVWMQRDPVYNVQSALEARLRQYGSVEQWYSFKVREYPELRKLDPLHAVAGQIVATNRSLERSFSRLPESKQLVLPYEEFCADPRAAFDLLKDKLELHASGMTAHWHYQGKQGFASTDQWRLAQYGREEVQRAVARMTASME